MTKDHIVWEVAPVPVGRYRSFERRGWPTAVSKMDAREAVCVTPTVTQPSDRINDDETPD